MLLMLLNTLFGAVVSMLPDAMKMFQDHRDKKHELEILDRQLKAQSEKQATEYQFRLKEIEASADIAENYAVAARAPITENNSRWVADFAAIVRPTLALAFFGLYAFYKAVILWHMPPFNELLPWQLSGIWGEEDMALFAGIMGFYFGGRAAQKMRESRGG